MCLVIINASFKYKSCLLLRGSSLAESISLAKLEANQTPGPSSSKDGQVKPRIKPNFKQDFLD